MPYPDWAALAPLVLAMSLAYLRLEVFSERRQIKNHAQMALQSLSEDPSQIPKDIRKMEMYLDLQALAKEKTKYQRRWDRGMCTAIAVVSGLIVIGTLFFPIEDPESCIHWIFAILVASSLCVEIFLVLYGGRLIKNSIKTIDHNAKQLSLAIQGSIASSKVEEARTQQKL